MSILKIEDVAYVRFGASDLAQTDAARRVGPNQAFATSLSQQMCALALRGLGASGAEADQIAAQASDEIVRMGAYSDAFKDESAT